MLKFFISPLLAALIFVTIIKSGHAEEEQSRDESTAESSRYQNRISLSLQSYAGKVSQSFAGQLLYGIEISRQRETGLLRPLLAVSLEHGDSLARFDLSESRLLSNRLSFYRTQFGVDLFLQESSTFEPFIGARASLARTSLHFPVRTPEGFPTYSNNNFYGYGATIGFLWRVNRHNALRIEISYANERPLSAHLPPGFRSTGFRFALGL